MAAGIPDEGGGQVEWSAGWLEALGEALGEAVEDHRHQRQGQGHLDAAADLDTGERVDDEVAERPRRR